MSRYDHLRAGLLGLSCATTLSWHTQGTGVQVSTHKPRGGAGMSLNLDSRFSQYSLKTAVSRGTRNLVCLWTTNGVNHAAPMTFSRDLQSPNKD